MGERFLALPARGARGDARAQDIAGLREGGHDDLAAELERSPRRLRARRRALRGDRRRPARRARAARRVDLGGHPRGAAAAGHRRRRAAPGRAGHRGPPRAASARWRGGFWLPECAHAPWLDPLLEEAGVHATCVDLTDVLGRGAPEHLRPLRSEAGPLLVPVDRATVELVWSDGGYPAHGAYRDYHHHTIHHHRPWANDGAPTTARRARALAREHAADFVAARCASAWRGGGLCVCALDTELLGHWWYEGPRWLRRRARRGRARRAWRSRPSTTRSSATSPAGARRELPVTTWGTPRDLSTWWGPRVADLAWRARDAELRVARGRRRAPSAAGAARAARAAGLRLGVHGHPRPRRRPTPRERARRARCARWTRRCVARLRGAARRCATSRRTLDAPRRCSSREPAS